MKLIDTPQFQHGMEVEAFLDAYFTALGYRIEWALHPRRV